MMLNTVEGKHTTKWASSDRPEVTDLASLSLVSRNDSILLMTVSCKDTFNLIRCDGYQGTQNDFDIEFLYHQN